MKDLQKLNTDYYESYGDAISVAKPVNYLNLYNSYFSDIMDNELQILELGVFRGESLEYFSKVFPNSTIYGIDSTPCDKIFSSPRIKFYQGLQDDKKLYEKMMSENNIESFDIVIDDCSHIGSVTARSFDILFPLLRSDGFYVIEDYGTGYWPSWPGGKKFAYKNHLKCKWGHFKSHQYGTPGFIKQLADEVAMGDITGSNGLNSHIESKLQYLHIYDAIVFMRKK